MARRKQFEAPPPVVVATTPIPEYEGGAVINVPDNATGVRIIDLTKWLGRGIDDWVWASAAQLRAFLSGQSVQPSTVIGYGKSGLPAFFQFLTAGAVRCHPAEFDRRRMDQFVTWLNDQAQWAKSSKKFLYSGFKTVLIGLQSRGVVPSDRSVFPPNPFPGSNASCKGETPLSVSERARFVEALRKDIVAIYKGGFDGSESGALTVHFLALAIRTGINLTPLLELRRDSLKPHPFMPSMMTLESFKRRGNATHLKNLRFSREEVQTDSIPMDGVALFNKVLQRTQSLADNAPKALRDCVWLYVSEGSEATSQVTKLSQSRLDQTTKLFIVRHDLRADDGERLRINTSRLRKTMENRLWTLSNGDLFAVASIMGHTPEVADVHYLACTEEMRKNATFVGEAMPDIYRGNGTDAETGEHKVIPIRKLENTPVGSCKDSLNGDRAPKNGTHCSEFFSCFSCRSYAIVGYSKDLHRLFSFYWFLDVERQRTRSREWREQFTVTMNLIDGFTMDKFDPALVTEAKDKARVEPLKFWKNYCLGEEGVTDNGTE